MFYWGFRFCIVNAYFYLRQNAQTLAAAKRKASRNYREYDKTRTQWTTRLKTHPRPAAQTLAPAKQNASQSSPKEIHKLSKHNSEPLPEKRLSQKLYPLTTHVQMLKP